MNIILAFVLLFSPVQADSNSSSSLVEQSKRQAVFYMQQINRQSEQEAGLWALDILYQSHPDLQSFISERIKERNLTQSFYRPFLSGREDNSGVLRDLVFTTGSPDLFIALLLKESEDSRLQLKQEFEQNFGFTIEDGIQYEAIADSIIKEGTIDSTLLPNESFLLPHFFFFMDGQGSKLFSDHYYSSMLKKWEGQLEHSRPGSLLYTLMQVSYFRVLYLTDQYDDTKKFFSFLTEDKLVPNSKLRYRLFRYLDYSMYRLGYFDLSLKATRDYAEPLTHYLKDKGSELSSLISQGVNLLNLGKIKEAQKINLEILKQAEQHQIPVPQSALKTNLGITYRKSGEFDKYLDLLLKALEESSDQENYDHRLTILMNLYLHYQENNNKESALIYLNEARKLVKREGSIDQLGRINMYFGIFYREFEQNYTLAQDYFAQAKSIIDSTNYYQDYVEILGEEIKIYETLNSYQKALKKYNRIVALSKSRNQVRLLEAYLAKINIYLKTDSLHKAKDLLAEVKSYDLSQLDFKSIIKAKKVEAEYLVKTGNPEPAYNILKPTIEQVVEWAKNSTEIQSGFWNIDPEFLDTFELMADLLIETGREEEAVEVLDKLKTINDASLYQNPMVKSSLLDETELTQYQRLTGQLDALRKKQLLASENEELSLQNKIDKISAQKRMLDRKISNMVDQKSLSMDQVQRQLAGREMVLHITELNDWYYMAKISRNDVQFNKIRLDSTLRAQFSGAIESLASGKTDINKLSKITRILDLDSLPSWISTLTIIPDSYLYQLPIDILPLSDNEYTYSYGGATYLVEQFKTHYLTSLNDFRPSDNTTNKEYKWDFVGYGVSDFSSYGDKKGLVPLPHAASEVSSILGNFTNIDKKTTYLDASSSERTFKETAPNGRILHLAAHSELSERDPLFSTIYMSPEKSSTQEDDFSGQIFAYELFELNLANDLIMLNSCESGSGSYLQGSGVMGISRALRYAGANSLILNLWSVNDMMASDFAIEFYKNLNVGQSKDEALRQTKLHFLKNKNANPHYWGPYMLIGDRDPVVRPYRKTNIYFAASFMLFFITIASISLVMEWKKKAA